MSETNVVGTAINQFGKAMKARRLEAGYGLNEYARLIDMDFSNYSKYERGIIKPPLDDKLLDNMMAPLNLPSDEREFMKKLAALQRAPEEVVRMLDSQNEEILCLKVLLEKQTAENERLRGLLADVIEPLGPCEHVDHHGYCQSHFLQLVSDCAVGKARAALGCERGNTTQSRTNSSAGSTETSGIS